MDSQAANYGMRTERRTSYEGIVKEGEEVAARTATLRQKKPPVFPGA